MNQNRKINLWLCVLAIIGLFLFVLFSWNDPSFRPAHDLTKEQAIARSADLWKQLQAQNVTGWAAQAVLDSEAAVDGYLNKYDLQTQFQQKAPKQAPLVFWNVSFQDPHRNQTLVMQIDHATGQLMSYELSGERFPSVVRESIARSMATVALQQVGVEAAKMQVSGGEEQTVVPAGSGAIGGRKPVLNHQRTYVFQDPAWKVGQLTLKYEVTITGNQVASVKPVYVLPNDYTAWHDRQKLVGTVLTGLCALFSFVLFVLGFVFLFLVKEKKRYGAALWLTLAIFVTYLVSNLNQLPVIQMEMLSKGIGGLTFLISNAVMVIVLAVISFVVAGGTFPMILTG
ncbi:MAG: hypothetical protein ACXVPK_13055, partial [Tumebacillaceae bacterium]